jgi:hypothetical protein
VAALRQAQLSHRLEPVIEKNSHVHATVARIISNLLELDDDRRPTAEEALEGVDNFLENAAISDKKLQRGIARLAYPRVIRDPVFGDIRLTEYEWRVLDTVEMQRLRSIRQLGFTNMVYPGAEHSRLSHSIGSLARVEQVLRTIEDNEGTRIDDSFPSWCMACRCRHRASPG